MLSLLHIDGLCSSKPILDCHILMDEKLLAQSGRWFVQGVSVFHCIFRCKSQHEHLLSPGPKGLRRLIMHYPRCWVKGRLWLCCGELSCLGGFGLLCSRSLHLTGHMYLTWVLMCLLNVLGFAPWPWMVLGPWNHPVGKWLRLPRVEQNFT